MTVIQNIILPEQALQTPLNMYFRKNRADFNENDPLEAGSLYDYGKKILILGKNDKYYFNTYYNGLSIQVWKENCRINTLALNLRGQGKILVEIAVMTREFDAARHKKNIIRHRVIAQKSLTLTAKGVSLPLETWPAMKEGMLYFTLYAAEEKAEFYGGSFETLDEPRHNIRLGIAITHYNRKQWVLPAMRRLKRDIIQHPYYSRHIGVTVVDNSNTITAAEADGVAVLPCANYGGAGGFARGLLHYKDSGFSHCLFMDDDASCETESIYRTLALLQYARLDNMAVSGAMLRECDPYWLQAKGDFYKNFRHYSSASRLHMAEAADLLAADDTIYPQKKGFGPWWHFAFPIAKTDYYPFPFFVRGDDVLFGLVNRFHIVTMNGIGNFAEDFASKNTPLMAYLDFRAIFLTEAILGNSGLASYFGFYKKKIRKYLQSYNFSHAHATNMAIEDFLKGMNFWSDNIDLQSVRKRMAEEAPGEVMQIYDTAIQGRKVSKRDSIYRKIVRTISCQGFLLPQRMIRRQTVLIPKNFNGQRHLSFRKQQVFYYGDNLKQGYFVEYNKQRFFKELWLSLKLQWRMLFRLKPILLNYKNNWSKLASESFWRQTYNLPPAGAAGQPTESAAATQPPAGKANSAQPPADDDAAQSTAGGKANPSGGDKLS